MNILIQFVIFKDSFINSKKTILGVFDISPY